ncbi:spermidine synthase [Phreatobacter sp.]|uniref:spermidine synthase n=1 Tax=Phreatobacter sp. TaxID=1966341 RepID=UPI0025CFB99F|nr:spermidine synthase [Phreatobacter sp.]
MSHFFQELDYQETPIGALSLRRRREHRLDVDVYEIKLGDEFLMSSLFTASEIALADLGLAGLAGGPADVAVAGLGLGYTAKAVLDHADVASLVVVEMLEPVIGWHRAGLLPMGTALPGDPRCRFVAGDFFALAASRTGLDPQSPDRRFDAVLVDIDHSPDELLMAAARASTRPKAWPRSRATSDPAAYSASGPMPCPIRPSSRGLPTSLPPPGPSR